MQLRWSPSILRTVNPPSRNLDIPCEGSPSDRWIETSVP